MPRPKTNIADASDSGECSGTSKTYNTRRSVVDSLPYDSRGYLQIDKITDEEIARFCEMSDEEFSEPFEDDGGEDYVPPVNDEESDIEDVRLGERIPIEKKVEVDSDEEEDLLTEVENTTMPPLADVYHSPDSTVWNKTPLPSSQTCQGSIYTGRLAGNERQVNIGEKTVMSLCQHYNISGRNITTDNFFTSLPLARALKSDGLTLVGTLKARLDWAS
ncbi:Transposase IS4 [Popillia japonica]|uniref:Transposase IS4 n=1 Tax=Popillia japonica TaxID=7064 RepID=A0AAW1ITG2_POPJA